MSKRVSKQSAQNGKAASEAAPSKAKSQAAPSGAASQAAPGKTSAPADSTNVPANGPSTPKPPDGPAGSDVVKGPDGTEVVNNLAILDGGLRGRVEKMLKEGLTFEDVVEAVNARGGQRITLNAVKTYFQGSRKLQTERARRQVEDAEALLKSVDDDPRSAEARLARATFLTGYARVHRNTSDVTAREAARYRMECENLNLKHQILVMQRKKAKQELDYSRAKTNLILITQAKVKGDILMLERELRAHHAGDPIGPEVLEKIQQLYGLVSQPMMYEEYVNAAANA